MARKPPKAPSPPPPEDAPVAMTFGQKIHESIIHGRIKMARARTPRPTYEQIAQEVGCCVKTVYNVLKAAEDG